MLGMAGVRMDVNAKASSSAGGNLPLQIYDHITKGDDMTETEAEESYVQQGYGAFKARHQIVPR